jgi:hypothetical protein
VEQVQQEIELSENRLPAKLLSAKRLGARTGLLGALVIEAFTKLINVNCGAQSRKFRHYRRGSSGLRADRVVLRYICLASIKSMAKGRFPFVHDSTILPNEANKCFVINVSNCWR